MGGVAKIIKSKPEIFKPPAPTPTAPEVSQATAVASSDMGRGKPNRF